MEILQNKSLPVKLIYQSDDHLTSETKANSEAALYVMCVDMILKLRLFHLVTDKSADGAHFMTLFVLCQLLLADARERYQAVLALGHLRVKKEMTAMVSVSSGRKS